MKTLPVNLRKNGFEYTQVLRGRRSCIYMQKVSKGTEFFEVFLIKIKPQRIIKGKTIKASEKFPPNDAFGKWAWAFSNLEKALLKYDEIENKK